MTNLQDKVILVTGGTSGIGAACSRHFAACGAKVVLASNQQNEGEALEAELRAAGSEALFVHTDVSDEASVSAAFAKALDALGGLDLLVANAGILKAHDIQEFPVDDWQRVMAVNLTGYFLCARVAARIFAAQKRGVIVQINSKSGKKGSFRNSAYAASKFGGIGLTQSLALDLAP